LPWFSTQCRIVYGGAAPQCDLLVFMRRVLALAAILSFIVPAASLAATSFVTGYALSGQPLRNDFAGWVGMKLTVGANPLAVSALGRICAANNSQTHTVKFVNAGDGSDVAGASVSLNMAGCTAGQFVYGAVSGVTLPAGASYYLVSQESYGGDRWYDQGAISTTNDGLVKSSVYFYGGNWIPINSANTSYVPPNFQYTVAGATPQFLLTTSVSPAGSGSIGARPAAVGGSYDSGTPVQLTANPAAGCAFVNWSGALTGAVNPQTVTMSAPQTVTANFQCTALPPSSSFLTGYALSGPPLRNDFSGWVGMKLSVGATPLAVLSLGRLCLPNNASGHLVKFVNVSDGGDVPGASVTLNMAGCAAGQFVYGAIAPTTLPAGASYYLASQEISGGDRWYDFGTVSSTGVAVVNSSVYFYGGNWIPIGSGNTSYVPVNFQYAAAVQTPISVTVQAGPTGPAFSVDGINTSSPQTLTWSAGSSHTIATTSPQSAGTGTQYAWKSWSDGGAISHTVTPSSAATFTSTFTTQYLLAASVSLAGGGSVAASPAATGAYYDAGTPVQLTATPNSGCTFVSWAGALTGAVNPQTVTLSAPQAVTANFQCSGPASTSFVTGYALSNPSVRNDFTGWVGMKLTVGAAPLTVTSLGRICVAGNSLPHTVKLVNAGNGSDVAGASAAVNMPGCAPGQFVYSGINSVTLPANTTYYLVSQEAQGGDRWYDQGGISTTAAAAVNSSVYFYAGNWFSIGAANSSYVPPSFQYTIPAQTQYLLTTSASPSSGGSVAASPSSASGNYNAGTQVQLTATPASGCTFVNWSGALTGTANPQTTTMSAPQSVTANFQCTPPPTGCNPAALSLAQQQLTKTLTYIGTAQFPLATDPNNSNRWNAGAAMQWSSGFFPGRVWQTYEQTLDSSLLTRAQAQTANLLGETTDSSTHDIGFRILSSYGNGYRITRDPSYMQAIQTAAGTLATLYQPTAGVFNSWPYYSASKITAIIDNMMNLELLFYAAQNGGDPNWKAMAISHALKTMQNNVRPDGSTYQGVAYNTDGSVYSKFTSDGFATESTWSRGQAWGLYGFTLTYRYTQDSRFLTTAQQLADYFIHNLPPDFVPYWDFSQAAPAPRDSSAAAIAAAGLLELSTYVPEPNKSTYHNAAINIQTSLSSASYLANPVNTDGILLHGTYNKPSNLNVDTSLIWGDYYFVRGCYAALSAPPSPANLVATSPVAGQIKLTWDAQAGAIRYSVKRSTASGGPYVTLAPPPVLTTSSFADTAVVSGATYYYVVSAIGVGGESSNSAEANASVTATQYLLTTNVSPTAGGSVAASPSSAGGNYNAGTAVQLTATPASGCTFVHWTGALTGATNPQTVTMTAPQPVIANFQCSTPPSSTTFVTAYALDGPGLRNDFSGWVGMKLSVRTYPVVVSSLGRICVAGNAMAHTVKFVNAGDGSDVPGASASLNMAGCTAGQFVFAAISPVTLPAGAIYYLVSQETQGGDRWYDQGRISPTNAAVVNSSVYFYGGNWIPISAPNTSYVPPNFQYSIVSSGGAPSDLSGYWSFDPAYVTGTTLLDQSTHANDATAYSLSFASGKIGQAIQLNGSSSHAEVALGDQLDLLNDLSLSVWVKTTNSSRVEGVIAKYDAGGSEYGYILRTTAGGTAEMQFGGSNVLSGNRVVTDVTKINDGNWHHIGVVIRLGVNVSFYIDGVPSSTTPEFTQALAASAPFEIGVNPYTYYGNYFTGSIDEVRVYKRALTAAEIFAFSNPSAPSGGSAPSVLITSPANSAQIAGVVTVSANAAASAGVFYVAFQLDGVGILPGLTAAPYSASWNTLQATSGPHTLTALAMDTRGNPTVSSPVTLTVTNPPVLGNSVPSGLWPAGTGQLTMALTTNEPATCRYSTSPATSYAMMTGTFGTTGGTTQSTNLGGLQNGTIYTYYVRCQDAYGYTNLSDYPINFSLAAMNVSNGLAQTPPMGWNSWNHFREQIDDSLIRQIADSLVSSGMRDVGYKYVIIDGGWEGQRDANGALQANSNFPDMKALAAYVHARGLKFGIYSSPGPLTCDGLPGSYGHEQQDANTFAQWGVDYLKYDLCSGNTVYPSSQLPVVYKLMGDALLATGRPIVYALCEYGNEKVWNWGASVGGNLWRTTSDVEDNWSTMSGIGFSQYNLFSYAGPGHWNDPDMLEIGNGGMTTDEYRTHMSLWAILAAPLLAGNDVRSMSADTVGILLNSEVIAIDQDAAGIQGHRLSVSGEQEIWIKPLSAGRVAVGLFNRSSQPANISVASSDLGFTGQVSVRDLWAHQAATFQGGPFQATVPSHGVVMLRIDPVP
jgi:alpha-galactosidase